MLNRVLPIQTGVQTGRSGSVPLGYSKHTHVPSKVQHFHPYSSSCPPPTRTDTSVFCSILQEKTSNPVQLNCKHSFDKDALQNHLFLKKNPVCPCCRHAIDKSEYGVTETKVEEKSKLWDDFQTVLNTYKIFYVSKAKENMEKEFESDKSTLDIINPEVSKINFTSDFISSLTEERIEKTHVKIAHKLLNHYIQNYVSVLNQRISDHLSSKLISEYGRSCSTLEAIESIYTRISNTMESDFPRIFRIKLEESFIRIASLKVKNRLSTVAIN